jgi:hypothetical protein
LTKEIYEEDLNDNSVGANVSWSNWASFREKPESRGPETCMCKEWMKVEAKESYKCKEAISAYPNGKHIMERCI